MDETQDSDLLGDQIDVNQVVSELSSLIPTDLLGDQIQKQIEPEAIAYDEPEQAEPPPLAKAKPGQVAAAEVAEPPIVTAPPEPVEKAVETIAGPTVQRPVDFTVRFGGVDFPFPAGTSDEVVSASLTAFKNSPSFDRIIDKESGAPGIVSIQVGPSGELSEDDRLATLREFYPEAIVYGKDNFLFVDKDTGKFTLYNPPGFEFRDVAEYGRTGAEVVFGGLGAAAGFVSSLATGPFAVVTAPTLGVIGAGIGAEVGVRVFDTSMGVFGRRIRTPKSLLGEFVETGIRVGLSATGQAAGPLIAVGGKRILTGGRAAAAQLVAKFTALGIEPVGAAIGRKGMLGRMGAGLEQMAAAAPPLQKQAEQVVRQLDSALHKISSTMGQIRTPTQAGAAIKSAVEAAEKRVRDNFSKKYDEVFNEIGDAAPVERMESLNSVLEPFIADFVELTGDVAPKGSLLELINKYSRYGIMAETGELTFKQLRAIRTQLRLIKAKSTSGTAGDYDNAVNKIYNAVTDDLSAAANSVRSDLAGKLKAIDKERFIFADTAQKTFDKIRKMDADNAAYELIITSAKGSGKSGVKDIQRLRDNFTPEEWGDVASSVLYNLGRENVGTQVGAVAEFSVATFMKNISAIKKAGTEGMETMFGGTQFADVSEDLMKLVDVVGALKEVKRYTNFSNSAGAMNQMIFWQALTSAGTGLAAGNVSGATAAIGGTVIAPYFAAKLMTSPAVIKWLSTPASQIAKDVTAHVARLVAIGQAEPEIQEELRQYYKAIRSYTGYDEPVNEGTAQ